MRRARARGLAVGGSGGAMGSGVRVTEHGAGCAVGEARRASGGGFVVDVEAGDEVGAREARLPAAQEASGDGES